MNVHCIYLKNFSNLPVTEGHFVVIDNNSEDLPWLGSEPIRFKCYKTEIPIRPFSCIVGRIKGNSETRGMTSVEFFVPLMEFIPRNFNSRMSINSGPCAGIKELLKTPYSGCIKNSDVIDLAFVFSPVTLENATHAATGMDNVFICRYMYCDENRVHDDIHHFASFVVTDLFDYPFPKRVWDGINIIQDICHRLLSTYSSKQGDYFYSTKKVNFAADVWKYLSVFRFDGHARQQYIRKKSTIYQRLDNGVVAKSLRDIRPAVQYVFQTQTELCSFRAIFGMTTTFGKRCCRPTVGDTKYLRHLDIINVVIPSTPQEVEAGKANGIVLRFDGNELVIKLSQVYLH